MAKKASPKQSHHPVWCNSDPVSTATSKLVMLASVLAKKLFTQNNAKSIQPMKTEVFTWGTKKLHEKTGNSSWKITWVLPLLATIVVIWGNVCFLLFLVFLRWFSWVILPQSRGLHRSVCITLKRIINSVPMLRFLENQSKFTTQYGITDTWDGCTSICVMWQAWPYTRFIYDMHPPYC